MAPEKEKSAGCARVAAAAAAADKADRPRQIVFRHFGKISYATTSSDWVEVEQQRAKAAAQFIIDLIKYYEQSVKSLKHYECIVQMHLGYLKGSSDSLERASAHWRKYLKAFLYASNLNETLHKLERALLEKKQHNFINARKFNWEESQTNRLADFHNSHAVIVENFRAFERGAWGCMQQLIGAHYGAACGGRDVDAAISNWLHVGGQVKLLLQGIEEFKDTLVPHYLCGAMPK